MKIDSAVGLKNEESAAVGKHSFSSNYKFYGFWLLCINNVYKQTV